MAITPEDFVKLIEKNAVKIVELHDRTLPIKVGVMAVKHFQDNFKKGGFVNDGLQKWQPSKRLLPEKKGGDKLNKTLLSGRKHLYNSTRHFPDIGEVLIINNVPYAAVHNEGLKAGRGKGFTMPKRKFIGESKELNEKIEKLIETEIRKVLNL